MVAGRAVLDRLVADTFAEEGSPVVAGMLVIPLPAAVCPFEAGGRG